MKSEKLIKLFISREYHAKIMIGNNDAINGSRIGGIAPKAFANACPKCPVCGRILTYYLSLGSDILPEFLNDRELSVFYCPDFECRSYAQLPWLKPSLRVIIHSQKSRNNIPLKCDSTMEGRALMLGSIDLDFDDELGSPSQGSKIGGQPGLIQIGEYEDEIKSLEKDGFQFLFQFDEESYPEDMEIGDAPFAFGAIYVYAKLDQISDVEGEDYAIAFWQTT